MTGRSIGALLARYRADARKAVVLGRAADFFAAMSGEAAHASNMRGTEIATGSLAGKVIANAVSSARSIPSVLPLMKSSNI